MIGTTIHELIVCLLRAELVEVDHLVERGSLVLLAGGRLWVAVVVKTAAIFHPFDVREANPFERFVENLSGGDIQDVHLLPIAPSVFAGVCEIAAVIGDVKTRESTS